MSTAGVRFLKKDPKFSKVIEKVGKYNIKTTRNYYQSLEFCHELDVSRDEVPEIIQGDPVNSPSLPHIALQYRLTAKRSFARQV